MPDRECALSPPRRAVATFTTMANQTAREVADLGAGRVRACDAFNQSSFSRFLNSPAGRIFRVLAGLGFVAMGARFHRRALGVAALAWSLLPLSAGGLDLCYISAALGGPLSGAKVREAQRRLASVSGARYRA